MSEICPPSPPANETRGETAAAAAKWRALQKVASAVADLAGIGADAPGTSLPDFPAMLAQTSGWRRNLAEDGLDDLIAMVDPGAGALLAAHAGGYEVAPAATALWREIVLARAAILDLVAPMELPQSLADSPAPLAHP